MQKCQLVADIAAFATIADTTLTTSIAYAIPQTFRAYKLAGYIEWRPPINNK